MIQITQMKLPVGHTPEEIKEKAAKKLRVPAEEIRQLEIVRRSLDLRDRSQPYYVYTVRVQVPGEKRILSRTRDSSVTEAAPVLYRFPESGSEILETPPVVIGSGPAGLFAAYMLALHGYAPLLLERGDPAPDRQTKVNAFWEGAAPLDPESNVQFGEGGAGTFSDGKLQTGVHDRSGRNTEVLRIFHQFGAPDQILYDAKPHLGTDHLCGIVQKMRNEIIRLGGTVRFRAKVTGLMIRDGTVQGIVMQDGTRIPARAVIPAVGHSARDTFRMFYEAGLPMEAKNFAVGVRAEHSQDWLNRLQYGAHADQIAAAADYKVTWTDPSGRGVYSFCMCPGGYVVNASSEPGRLAVNGMSYHDRAGVNANSAIVTSVGPRDFAACGLSPVSGEGLSVHGAEIFAGMRFQQRLEEAAYKACGGRIPVQRLEDFRTGTCGNIGSVLPAHKGLSAPADLRKILPESASCAILAGFEQFGKRMPGFDAPDVLLSGVESRTSSPVRILRDETGQSAVRGIYPCGEGAGYAGGITSAAIDGIRTAEQVARRFRPGFPAGEAPS